MHSVRQVTGPTVSASYCKAFVEFVATLGADRDELFARAVVDSSLLIDPDRRIPLADYKSLVAVAKTLTRNPAIALHFGECPLFFERSILGLIIRASETIGEAFQQMNRYGPVVNDFGSIGTEGRFVAVRERNGGVWLEDRRRNPNEFPDITESAFARLVCELERIFPDRGRFARTIHMTHDAPPYRAEYERIMKAPLTFGATRNAILIHEAWLDAPFPTANRYVFGIFSAHADALMKEVEQSKTVRGRIESLIIPVLHTGDVSMDDVAAKMGLSRSSLYRRLREEAVSFDKVLDDLRWRMAEHYLAANKTTIAEIAYLVGFADPGAFSKAYRRWTGKTPTHARR